jgi:hypothetical protein
MKAFVIFRDRVSYAKQCVASLREAGLDVHIIDHGSTYPPAMDWITLDIDLGVGRVHRYTNRHPQELWRTWGLREYVEPGERFIVTDCDVVVDESCPNDWVEQLEDILRRYPNRRKVGLGLRTDDLPDHYQHRRKVIEWEHQHWMNPVEGNPPYLYGAAVDTTLALYQPLDVFASFSLGPALRTGYPYMARHLSWYEDSSNPSNEQRWYEQHMNRDFSHWIAPERYS